MNDTSSARPADIARAQLAAGQSAIVWRDLIADTETPVSAALKLFEAGRGDFILESVEGARYAVGIA